MFVFQGGQAMLVKFLVCVLAGLGAGIGTGLAGLSAAAVISPMLVTFLGFPSYQAVAISLASDVLASAVSAYTYGRHKNLDIKNGSLMLGVVLVLTLVGSLVAFQMPNDTMSTFSVLMTLVLGLRFIICPVTGTHSLFPNSGRAIRVTESVVCGIVIGFICGFIGAGGGTICCPWPGCTSRRKRSRKASCRWPSPGFWRTTPM